MRKFTRRRSSLAVESRSPGNMRSPRSPGAMLHVNLNERRKSLLVGNMPNFQTTTTAGRRNSISHNDTSVFPTRDQSSRRKSIVENEIPMEMPRSQASRRNSLLDSDNSSLLPGNVTSESQSLSDKERNLIVAYHVLLTEYNNVSRNSTICLQIMLN